LGPVEASDGGGAAVLGRQQWRALLAYLLLRRNQVVSTEELVEALWGAPNPTLRETKSRSASPRIGGD